ncbi:MAG TPA: hypothetical protein PKJ33_02425 [Alphaproteobacteria bacterium]|nr:hypothetical protein [Alphaproteobacteria bacterium]
MQKLIILPLLTFVAACTTNTQSKINDCAKIICDPIYGRDSDWNKISDDLARNIYKHNRTCEETNR